MYEDENKNEAQKDSENTGSVDNTYNSYSQLSEKKVDYVKPDINGQPDTSNPYAPKNEYNSYGNYSSYGSFGNNYGNYSNRSSYGNSQGYSSNPYSNGSNSYPKNKKNYWLIPLAVILCFTICLGCFFVGLSMTTNSGYGEQNGGTQKNPISGSNNTQETEKSPFLGGGDVTLEQLPSDSVYYTIPSVVAATQDTVVEITTEVKVTGSYWGQYVTEGAGSGVIIKSYSENGESGACGTYIVTNNHVIDGAISIKVKLRNGTEYPATLVATDPQTDIAVLHVNETNLPVATLGTSSTLVAGQSVILIGNPLGSLGGSVSSGIISCTERNILIDDVVMKLIKTTAAVNPGNSGGAMFDLEGKLVAVVNAKYSDEQIEGIGFAIPIDIAAKVASDLINYGYVKGRPNHGITAYYGYCTYRNVYVNYDGAKVQGVWSSQIDAGSDAEKAGMLSYDLINSVIAPDGKTYTFASAAAADSFFDSLSVGDEITVNVYRFTASGSMLNTSFEREEHSFTFTITEFTNS